MKFFILNLFLTILALVVLVLAGTSKFDKEFYISKKVLEMSTPLGVTIDIQALKSLSPAYEQQ